jgi:hypothetical protein
MSSFTYEELQQSRQRLDKQFDLNSNTMIRISEVGAKLLGEETTINVRQPQKPGSKIKTT